MKCKAKTKSGGQCKNKAIAGSNRCHVHTTARLNQKEVENLFFKDAL